MGATTSLIGELPTMIDRRYRVEKLLGRGGMAVVCAVYDGVKQRRVALKRMLPPQDPTKRARNQELFEREFHMLSQLAHPRIVQTFDFGVDAGLPYYTLELLEGRELQPAAPLPWREACAVARDVCSALSLLHSRRFVHRDVSPRNVHILAGGTAKLIDFGGVAAMGSTKLLVGTPPCCAPECTNLQSLDARTDLFALGATLYYALVGQHAFAGARFSDLADVWRRGVTRPSALVPDIPEALDALVLDLLRLEPDARPASAADVMYRLTAIDGALASDEQRTAASYLATPPLVGRDAQLAYIERAAGEPPRSVLFEGPPGVGRTRLLDACALQATLRGCTVVRCDADDAASGDYGVARALARQLHDALGEIANPSQPELEGLFTTQPVSRAELQFALQRWLLTLLERQPFVLAIDDFHRIDEPSASLLALIEDRAARSGLWLLLTAESGATWSAQAARKLLHGVTRIELSNLSAADSEMLLGSLFADAPHVNRLAQLAHGLCRGNPRDLLRLAQHLVDRGLAYYESGAWTLPAELDQSDLPADLSQALAARITSLDPSALRLAWALALCPDQSFDLEDCARLSREPDSAHVRLVREQLTTRELARLVDERLMLAELSWIAPLRANLPHAAELALEHELGALFEARAQQIRAAKHWFRAGEPAHALDILVEHARVSQEETAHGSELFAAYLRSLPNGWLATFEEGLLACDRLGRPARDRFYLLGRLSGIMPLANVFAPQHVQALFELLAQSSGLCDWQARADISDPRARLMTALGQASARFDTAPDHERVVDVSTAIQCLVRSAITACAGIAGSLDLAHMRSWPQLEPLTPLSPAVAVAQKLVAGVDARCAGRVPRAQRLYGELIERVQQPDRAGLDASHSGYILLGVMNGLGMLEALDGRAESLDWADRIGGHPSYAVNAYSIRMLYALFQGDVLAAEEYKRGAERLRIQNLSHPVYDGQQLLGEVQAYALSGDLTRLRRAQLELAPFTKRFSAWELVLHYAKAEYQLALGSAESALSLIEQTLERTGAGQHPIWPALASAHVQCLIDLERDEAADVAAQHIEAAERELEYVPARLALLQALASADAGALARAQRVVSELQRSGFGKLHLGAAHELCARIALRHEQRNAFESEAELCTELWSMQKNPALTARCHRLKQAGWRTLNGDRANLPSMTPQPTAADLMARIGLALGRCADESERARLALTILLSHADSTCGVLFSLSPEGPYCAAQQGEIALPEAWSQQIAELLAQKLQETGDAATQTQDDELPSSTWIDQRGRTYQPVLLAHTEGDSVLLLTGVAVIATREDGRMTRPDAAATAISRFFAEDGSMSLSLILE